MEGKMKGRTTERGVWYHSNLRQITWMFSAWAAYSITFQPVQAALGLANSTWKIGGGPGIPYLHFPALTLAILIGSCLAKLAVIIVVYKALRLIFGNAGQNNKLLSLRNASALRRVGRLLLIFSALDLLTFPVAYLSLALLDPRVQFEVSVFLFLALVIPPDKLVLAGLALGSAEVLKRGATLDEEANLTI
ncbi:MULTISPECIES: DUF2975 domain-containing protein [Burkholderia]|uniref:DUF2975 domain-containing protein n=1 Tax=Burkholderia TaxID=32008 RepID=UPI000F579C6A|nr:MULTISPECIES: DUF2975 domain-containing protein [Burkholderia]MBR8406196.1 DUF2975 domain-containing protein [Burkholderia cenocepacia]MDN7696576.1 DUF2975 domain-containing protein [Burkholderia cenocepacia]